MLIALAEAALPIRYSGVERGLDGLAPRLRPAAQLEPPARDSLRAVWLTEPATILRCLL